MIEVTFSFCSLTAQHGLVGINNIIGIFWSLNAAYYTGCNVRSIKL